MKKKMTRAQARRRIRKDLDTIILFTDCIRLNNPNVMDRKRGARSAVARIRKMISSGEVMNHVS